jgi:hypothetical protein
MPDYLVVPGNNKHDLDKDDQEVPNGKKKRLKDQKENKEKFKDLGEMVKNNQVVQDWILPGNKHKAIFTKEVISMTPPFNDTGLITCNKWHIRGFCYEKCDRRGSHKKFESISHKTAFDSWVKALKNKAP